MEQRWQLERGLTAPGQARRHVASALQDVLTREDVESATLVVSELVTNAVLHAGTGCEVHLVLEGRVLRLRVLDGEPRQPVRRLAFSDELGTGRGLRMLEVLARRWGVEQTVPPEPAGKAVWCELTVHPVRGGAPA